MKRFSFHSQSGKVSLELTYEDAQRGHHPGPCDADIDELLTVPYIARQLASIPRDVLAAELREYGTWDNQELADPAANQARMLWIACGDIVEWNN